MKIADLPAKLRAKATGLEDRARRLRNIACHVENEMPQNGKENPQPKPMAVNASARVARARPNGLTQGQQVLASMRGQTSTSVKEIAEKIKLSSSRVSALLYLESKKGHVGKGKKFGTWSLTRKGKQRINLRLGA